MKIYIELGSIVRRDEGSKVVENREVCRKCYERLY